MKLFFLLFLLSLPLQSFGGGLLQPEYFKFRIYLKDKGDSGYSVDNPSLFLSEKAIERKKNQHVKIEKSDFPISTNYFTLVEEAGGKVVSHSKWFETLVIQVDDSTKINNIQALNFVDSVKYIWKGDNNSYRHAPRPRVQFIDSGRMKPLSSYYGYTEPQFSLHNAKKMIDSGFRGKGITVGVIDAGFTNFDVIPLFGSVDLLGYTDFVPEGDIFSASDHGTKVLSTMAVEQPGLMVGSAPEASYMLLRSEDVASEYPVEEDYWVRAVEYADSVGLDIINTSLGYSHFDDKELNYSHADLTGEVSLMSMAADLAYEKGLLLVVSAGNEGNKPWKKSTPPGDARNVITVGAVGADSIIAPFSSHGLMADGRIKPDLVSVGRGTVTIGREGLLERTNGTSLSSPFLAGLAASLWSVNPGLHRSELVNIILQSSDRFAEPDSLYGYGIPDFTRALGGVLETVEKYSDKGEEGRLSILVQSPVSWQVDINSPRFFPADYSLRLLDEAGSILSEHEFDESYTLLVSLTKEVRRKNKHLYFVLSDPEKQDTYRLKL